MTEVSAAKARRDLVITSIVVFVVCLPFSALRTNGEDANAFMLLLLGPFGFFAHPANLSWLANPLLVFSWGFRLDRYDQRALGSTVLALVLALIPLFSDEIVTNEGGVPTQLESLMIGYWIWLGAIAIAIAARLPSASAPELGDDPNR